MHKFNGLTNLQKNMENIIRELGEGVEKFGKDNMMEGFKDTYSNVMAQLGITEFDMVPRRIMEESMARRHIFREIKEEYTSISYELK